MNSKPLTLIERIGYNLLGVVQGKRWRVSSAILEMNTKVRASHRAAPWWGNSPGYLYQCWLDDYNETDDYNYDYDEED